MRTRLLDDGRRAPAGRRRRAGAGQEPRDRTAAGCGQAAPAGSPEFAGVNQIDFGSAARSYATGSDQARRQRYRRPSRRRHGRPVPVWQGHRPVSVQASQADHLGYRDQRFCRLVQQLRQGESQLRVEPDSALSTATPRSRCTRPARRHGCRSTTTCSWRSRTRRTTLVNAVQRGSVFDLRTPARRRAVST